MLTNTIGKGWKKNFFKPYYKGNEKTKIEFLPNCTEVGLRPGIGGEKVCNIWEDGF